MKNDQPENPDAGEQYSSHLRNASAADIPTLISLEESVGDTKIYSPMLETSEWEDELRKGKVLIIEKDHAPIGSVSYELLNDNSAYISGLVVHPDFREQGIAKEAMLQILEALKDVEKIKLVTHPENKKALRLYQSLGFFIESEQEDYFGDGEPRLVLVLQKTDQVKRNEER